MSLAAALVLFALCLAATDLQCPTVPDPLHIIVDEKNAIEFQNGSPAYPFDQIQEGIDAAGPGGEVYVAAGNYAPFLLDKNVSLRGGGIDAVRIYQEDPCIVDGVSGPALTGLTFISAGDVEHHLGTGLWIRDAGEILVLGCKFPFFEKGILLEDADAVVAGSIIEDSDFGVLLSGASSAGVFSNIIVNNHVGIGCEHEPTAFEQQGNTFGPDSQENVEPSCG